MQEKIRPIAARVKEIPKIDLSQAVKDANEEARAQNPRYKGELHGFAGQGADLVWKFLPQEAREKWDGAQLPRAMLVAKPDALKRYAELLGFDLTKI